MGGIYPASSQVVRNQLLFSLRSGSRAKFQSHRFYFWLLGFFFKGRLTLYLLGSGGRRI